MRFAICPTAYGPFPTAHHDVLHRHFPGLYQPDDRIARVPTSHCLHQTAGSEFTGRYCRTLLAVGHHTVSDGQPDLPHRSLNYPDHRDHLYQCPVLPPPTGQEHQRCGKRMTPGPANTAKQSLQLCPGKHQKVARRPKVVL